MKCINCNEEINPKDRFCSHCGTIVDDDTRNISTYEDEIRQFTKKQEDAENLERSDEYALSSPTEVLKAQLRLLTSINRRLEKLETNDKQKVRVVDFDMPFWSLVSFELKVFLVSLFFMLIFSCIIFLIFSSFLKDVISLPFIF
jgi:hypothetical protein